MSEQEKCPRPGQTVELPLELKVGLQVKLAEMQAVVAQATRLTRHEARAKLAELAAAALPLVVAMAETCAAQGATELQAVNADTVARIRRLAG